MVVLELIWVFEYLLASLDNNSSFGVVCFGAAAIYFSILSLARVWKMEKKQGDSERDARGVRRDCKQANKQTSNGRIETNNRAVLQCGDICCRWWKDNNECFIYSWPVKWARVRSRSIISAVQQSSLSHHHQQQQQVSTMGRDSPPVGMSQLSIPWMNDEPASWQRLSSHTT